VLDRLSVSMLVSRRSFSFAPCDATHETHAVVGSHFRLHVVRTRRLVLDDRLYMQRGRAAAYDRGRVTRPLVVIPLAGRVSLRDEHGESWLEPGEMAVVDSKARVMVRQQDDYVGLALEWEPGRFGAPVPAGIATVRVAASDLAGLAARAARITQVEDVGDEVVDVLGRLRAIGVPFERIDARALLEWVPDPMLRLSKALDHALSNLSEQPMWIDLAPSAARSPRQLQRNIARFNERFGFAGRSWRETRDRRRLTIGVPVMTAPGATTEDVAAALGYGSPSAFCRAFAHAGLASPGSIARVAHDLG
jgi:AraC-like DNA-binding protein